MIVIEQLNLYSTTVGLLLPLTLFILISLVLTKRKKQTINCDALLDAWTPEPLVDDIPEDKRVTYNYITDQKSGHTVSINGKQCVNFATHNYLSLTESSAVEESAEKCIRKYGIGSCGPRGFYGTIDVHLDLEKDLAEFMKVEEAVVYSFAFSTSASAIYAYIKKRDIVFADENVSFAIQTGLIATRCKVLYFKHNNMAHLEQLMKQVNDKDISDKKVTRRFIVVEGIYMSSADICPLKDILGLRAQYQARLFLDESLSFGTLGDTGRGVTEYFGVDTEEVDMIIGSLECALGSVGGFCLGSSFIIEHHVLSGAGYCFSASLPPFLAVAANTGLKLLKEKPSMLKDLKNNCNLMHEMLSQDIITEKFTVQGHRDTPIKHLYLRDNTSSEEETSALLQDISHYCMSSGFAVVCPNYLEVEANKPKPSIRLTCNVSHTRPEMERLIAILCEAYDKVVSKS